VRKRASLPKIASKCQRKTEFKVFWPDGQRHYEGREGACEVPAPPFLCLQFCYKTALDLALILVCFLSNPCEHTEQTVELTCRNEIRGEIKVIDRTGS